MKTHFAVQTKTVFGNGTLTTTLCGRSNRQSTDGFNSTAKAAEVTCEFCRKIMADPKHWRARKFLKAEAA